jgi:hypothetical protein
MRAILWFLLIPWKVLPALLMWELKLHIPSLASMIAPVVLKKGLPRIIGLWIIPSMSMMINLIGTKVICNSTRTLWTPP